MEVLFWGLKQAAALGTSVSGPAVHEAENSASFSDNFSSTD